MQAWTLDLGTERTMRVSLEHISGVSWPSTPKDFPEPSHGRVSRERFHSVYVVKGV